VAALDRGIPGIIGGGVFIHGGRIKFVVQCAAMGADGGLPAFIGGGEVEVVGDFGFAEAKIAQCGDFGVGRHWAPSRRARLGVFDEERAVLRDAAAR